MLTAKYLHYLSWSCEHKVYIRFSMDIWISGSKKKMMKEKKKKKEEEKEEGIRRKDLGILG